MIKNRKGYGCLGPENTVVLCKRQQPMFLAIVHGVLRLPWRCLFSFHSLFINDMWMCHVCAGCTIRQNKFLT